MTTTDISTGRSVTTPLRNLRRVTTDTLVIARRNVSRTLKEPESLIDVTISPLVFTLLFAYVIGAAIVLPGGASYREYLIPGMFAMTMASTASGTAVAVNTDMSTGIIDRFRSLPMSRAGVLAGQSLADLGMTIIALAVLAAAGFTVGWRINGTAADAAAAFALTLLFAYALNWAMTCLGLVFRSAEGAQQVGLIIMLGLTFISSAFVPTARMPAPLRAIANWNPVSALTAASRHLFGNPNPAAAIHAWPMQHPVAASLTWSLAMIAVFAPLAVHLYRTRTHR
ncbi:MAG TPA: ABC transporter permease [Trebonia sp.]|jgi:ABC-2 type transport system permease protein|nr:ABC transporter permease [Trebonia sp.]